MKKFLIPFLLLSAFCFSQNKTYASIGAGVVTHKKITEFDVDAALGYQFKNYFLEVNSIYSKPNSTSLSVSNVVFGLENKSDKLLKISAFTGLGVAVIDGNGSLNFQLGVNLGIKTTKNSSAGLKVSNNFNNQLSFTAMNLYYKFNL
ncbi:hypothetical protein PGH12_01490 [Chryseobacterium wangxinyae]|uniref:hypothetical protein n=1 Tax=Chryseobacterium sp. CY350 TaxID=2997336 RepID=UPI002271AFC6|nr:hypothetical protein [Chryseobacterium sp. CY350]MCY0977146.1 hypothetical protein [Chryseobacterium sp. CY350]WBZ95834.1 hypothetical protein PGH12_01490 [Chryseobacterium sp. CY350]